MTKTISTLMLFRDPTLQVKDVTVVRYVTVKYSPSNDPRKVAARKEYAALKKEHPEVKVGMYDFLPTKTDAHCLVWQTDSQSLAMVLPKWCVGNPKAIERVRRLVEGTKDYGKGDHASMDARIWRGFNEAYNFAEGKPGVTGFHWIRGFLPKDPPHPEVLVLSVPNAYVDAVSLPGSKVKGHYSYSEPFPFTCFLAGQVLCSEGLPPILSRHSPDCAIFLDDKRGWLR